MTGSADMAVSFRNACRRLQRTDFVVNNYTEVTPAGMTLEDAMTYAYWINEAGALRLNDIVNLIAADGAFDATLRVIRLAPGFIEFRVLNEWRPPIQEAGSGRLELGWAGPKGKWFVREVATGKKIVEGLEKGAAVAELSRLDNIKDAA
jgi:hypothetical protein